jgi:hypothetical protein
MVDRINLNRKDAAAYVGTFTPEVATECAAGTPTQAERDACEWRDLLAGAETKDG